MNKNTILYAQNFRGFKTILFEIKDTTFVVGDNSSGKTSLLHLVEAICSADFLLNARLNETITTDRNDFFSPYFDYADVTLGFQVPFENQLSSKIITLRREKTNLNPTRKRFSLSYSGRFVSFKFQKNGLQKKVVSINEFDDLTKLINIHNINTNFLKHSLKKDQRDANVSRIMIELFGQDKGEIASLIDAFFETQLPNTRHIGPIRGLPQKYYKFERKIKKTGDHFASMFEDLNSSKRDELIGIINKFGQDAKLFDAIKVARFSKKMLNSPLFVTVLRGTKEFLIDQVGIGVSQVAPIIVECIFSLSQDKKPLVLVQQPELHLHPVAQAALGDFIYEMNQQGIKFILETHSTFLMDRYRARIRENKGRRAELSHSILFCENTSTGNIMTEITIDETGRLGKVPDSYHAFFIDELLRTMD